LKEFIQLQKSITERTDLEEIHRINGILRIGTMRKKEDGRREKENKMIC